MKTKSKTEQPTGYRLDFPMDLTGTWAEYTSVKRPESLAFIESLARGLKRQGQAGRIVKVTGREKTVREFIEVVESWDKNVVQPI